MSAESADTGFGSSANAAEATRASVSIAESGDGSPNKDGAGACGDSGGSGFGVVSKIVAASEGLATAGAVAAD